MVQHNDHGYIEQRETQFFTKINLDISLGLKLPKLKVHTYVFSKNSQTFYFFRQGQVSLSAKIMIILVEKTLIIFGHAAIISIIYKSL